MASSNFFARMSSLFDSWNHESANLSSRWRFCSARIPAASFKSIPGPAFGGASCEITTPSASSITSFALQQGQTDWIVPSGFLAIATVYAFFLTVEAEREASWSAWGRGSGLFLGEVVIQNGASRER